jgi:hypothetical protein
MTESEEYVDDEVMVEPAHPPKRIRWSPPVEWNNKSFDSIVVREPTGGQLMEIKKVKDSQEQLMKLIQLNANIPMQVALLLPQGVLKAAETYFVGFSPESQETGSD